MILSHSSALKGDYSEVTYGNDQKTQYGYDGLRPRQLPSTHASAYISVQAASRPPVKADTQEDRSA